MLKYRHIKQACLVEALDNDVAPHGPVDEGLSAPMGGFQQQVRGGVFSGQCCTNAQTDLAGLGQ